MENDFEHTFPNANAKRLQSGVEEAKQRAKERLEQDRQKQRLLEKPADVQPPKIDSIDSIEELKRKKARQKMLSKQFGSTGGDSGQEKKSNPVPPRSFYSNGSLQSLLSKDLKSSPRKKKDSKGKGKEETQVVDLT